MEIKLTTDIIASAAGILATIGGIVWGLIKYILSSAEKRINSELKKLAADYKALADTSKAETKAVLEKLEELNKLVHSKNNEVQKLNFYYESLLEMRQETNTVLKEMRELLHEHDTEIELLKKH